MLTGWKVSCLAYKCVFSRPDAAKGEPHGTEF